MSIEEAKEILNEVVITEPSIKSYNYISADEINMAIQKLVMELEHKESELEQLKLRNNKKYYINKKEYINYTI